MQDISENILGKECLVLPVKVKLELQMAYSFKHKSDSQNFPKKALVGTLIGLYVKEENQQLHRKSEIICPKKNV